MKNYLPFLLLLLILSSCSNQYPMKSLRNRILEITVTKEAVVGVAIMDLSNRDTLTLNNDHQFPMQSVFKFHLALAVLDQVDKGKFSLDQEIFISRENLLPDIWSPLREEFPEGDTSVSLGKLINYTVSKSDNVGCDILFNLIGGPDSVDNHIRSLGITDFLISANEAEMHRDWDVQFTNWTKPLAAVQLLDKFFSQNILSISSREFLWNAMVESETGPQRIKGQLPSGTIVGHKTGSSGQNESGVTAVLNDIGIVTLPNRNHFAIAVFVSNSLENEEENQKIIADISKAAWDYFVSKTE